MSSVQRGREHRVRQLLALQRQMEIVLFPGAREPQLLTLLLALSKHRVELFQRLFVIILRPIHSSTDRHGPSRAVDRRKRLVAPFQGTLQRSFECLSLALGLGFLVRGAQRQLHLFGPVLAFPHHVQLRLPMSRVLDVPGGHLLGPRRVGGVVVVGEGSGPQTVHVNAIVPQQHWVAQDAGLDLQFQSLLDQLVVLGVGIRTVQLDHVLPAGLHPPLLLHRAPDHVVGLLIQIRPQVPIPVLIRELVGLPRPGRLLLHVPLPRVLISRGCLVVILSPLLLWRLWTILLGAPSLLRLFCCTGFGGCVV
mmetsp:Transcript_87303/g.151926  ORF Transcript_87303/g.151926 Transcript_87303/m.151926 type:complete len:307 (+) Transcript_87303:733-1653(+)